MQPIPRSTISKHLARLKSRWPVDPVRPSFISVQTYLQSRLDPPPPPQEQSSSQGLFASLFKKKSTANQEAESSANAPREPPLLSAKRVDALYSLLENRYQKEYPLPAALRHPTSRPDHYDMLLKEFEEAPDRGWWGRVKKRVGGSLRLK